MQTFGVGQQLHCGGLSSTVAGVDTALDWVYAMACQVLPCHGQQQAAGVLAGALPSCCHSLHPFTPAHFSGLVACSASGTSSGAQMGSCSGFFSGTAAGQVDGRQK